jgi:peptidoglycan hydrolase-like protein with peptidoglycan-binding domain
VITQEWIRLTMVETAYNGWPASRDPHAIGVDAAFAPAGVHFPGGVKSGDVSVLLGYLATQIHVSVEKLVPGWCWGYEYRQNVNDPSSLSVHSAACAIDVNAPNHPNGASGTFTAAQVKRIRSLLAAAGGVIAWGRDWTHTKDEMHFEIKGTVSEVAYAARHLKGLPAPPTAPLPFPLPAGYYFGPLSGPKESISGMAGDGSDEQYRPAIAAIQRVVHVRVDGLYGPVTIHAVTGWQASHRLQADGLTGPITWRAMQPR